MSGKCEALGSRTLESMREDDVVEGRNLYVRNNCRPAGIYHLILRGCRPGGVCCSDYDVSVINESLAREVSL